MILPQGGDLHPHDDLDPRVGGGRDVACPQRAVDRVVVGDRQHVQAKLVGPLDQGARGRHAVTRRRVGMQLGQSPALRRRRGRVMREDGPRIGGPCVTRH